MTRRRAAAAAISVLAVLALPGAAMASTITVDTIDDDSTASTCALRDAIDAAKTNAAVPGSACVAGSSSDTIDFSVTGTILLQSELPSIFDNVLSDTIRIEGPGLDQLTVRRSAGAPRFRVLEVQGNVVISGLTVTGGLVGDDVLGGEGEGAGIRNNFGTLTLDAVRVTGNVVEVEGGGGDVARGGGIFSFGGPLTITNSVIDHNAAIARSTSAAGSGSLARGGGIHIESSATTITGTSLIGNSARLSGHGMIDGSARGGGVSADGDLEMHTSTIAGNSATATSEVSSQAEGGGLAADESTASIDRTTITGNEAGASGTSPTSRGGGIFDETGPGLTIHSSTIAANVLPGGSANLDSSFADLENTIVADPIGPGAVNCFSPTPLTSTGHNLEDGTSCGFTNVAAGDQSGTDPLLSYPLADNGGPTETLALSSGSPAIDAGRSPGETADQRGLARPVDLAAVPNAPTSDGTDIGAFEVQAPPVTPVPPATPTPPVAGPTGERAAALKKCKKKKSKKARKKCKRRARRLPV